MSPSRVALIWYFHLPWVSQDDEVRDLARESLEPLLTAHEQTRTAATIAVTGALLVRLADVRPACIERMRDLARMGLIEIAGTFFYEIAPNLFNNQIIEAHLRRDREIKSLLFGIAPEFFFPANYCWTPALPYQLWKHGLRRLILDDTHLHLANSSGGWQSKESSALFDDATELWERAAGGPYLLTLQEGASTDGLCILFRASRAVEATTYGSSGAIHKPLDAALQDKALAVVDSRSGIVALADDGDRINPWSVVAYRHLLSRIGPARCLTATQAAATLPAGRLDFLPSYSSVSVSGFTQGSAETLHWKGLLDELHRRRPKDFSDRVLRLHDVYPLFWRFHWRSRLFYSEIIQMLDEVPQASEESARLRQER